MKTFLAGFVTCGVLVAAAHVYFWINPVPVSASQSFQVDGKMPSLVGTKLEQQDSPEQEKEPLPEPFWVRTSDMLRILSHERPTINEEDKLWAALEQWRQRPEVRRNFCVSECRLSGGGHENLYLDVLVIKRPSSQQKPLTIDR